MEAGTSCAMATRPTSRMTVANIISRILKPRCPSPSLVDECRIPCFVYTFVRRLAGSFPRSACRRGPNLCGAGRKQNHGAITVLVWVRSATHIENVYTGRQCIVHANRSARVKLQRTRIRGGSWQRAHGVGISDGRGSRRSSPRRKYRPKTADPPFLLYGFQVCV